MKKLTVILAMLLILSLVSCSSETSDVPETSNITTKVLDTIAPDTTAEPNESTAEETTAPPDDSVIQRDYFFMPEEKVLAKLALSAYRNETPLEIFLSDPSAQKFMAQNLSEILDTDISWGDFDVHIVEIGAMYPMTIVLSVYDGYDTMINFSTSEKGVFLYSTPYKMYGRYETDNLMSVGHSEYYQINREDMDNAIFGATDVDDLTIKYVAVSLSEIERKITVPVFSGNEPYVAVLKIEDDLTYTLESFQKLDFGTMTVYDFLVTYKAFGFEPLDLVLNDCGIPLSPESAILDMFGTLEVLESMYAFSEFFYSPYVRLRTNTQFAGESEIDVSFYLVDKLTGEKVNTTTLSPDAKFDDFVWKIS